VSAIQSNGREWTGTCVDLSTFGIKVRPDHRLAPAPTVRLSFTPPDGGHSLYVLSAFVRGDEPDGYVYRFLNLTAAEFARLDRFVERLVVHHN
jgi:hypothetical protein